MNSKKLAIIIPIYFNQNSLADLFIELKKIEYQLFLLHVGIELIFVDDGSEDNSLQLIIDFKIKNKNNNIKIVKLTRNFGAVQAIKTGLNYVTADVFIFLAADLQDPPNLIVDMVKKWLSGSKYIICVRNSRNDPLTSVIFSKLFYFLVRKLVISDFPKSGFDLAMMDKVFLPVLLNSSKSMFPPLLSFWIGYKPDIILYDRQKRIGGKSKWTISKKITSFLDVILGFSIKPMRLMLGLGLFIAFSSFCYGGMIIINYLIYGSAVKGFSTIIALITFFFGIIILMLGIIGEYLIRIFNENNKRPETVIEQIW